MVGHHAQLPFRRRVKFIAAENCLQVIVHSALLRVLSQMAEIASHRRENSFGNLIKLGIVAVGSIGFGLITAPRLTAHDQVAANSLTILARTEALYGLGAVLRRRNK